MLVLFCLPVLVIASLLLYMLGCMDAQRVLAQTRTIPPFETVC